MERSNAFSLVLCLFIFLAFATMSTEARKHHSKNKKHHKNDAKNNPRGCLNSPAPAPAPLPLYEFSILSFGAKANGVSDDSKVRTFHLRYIHAYFACILEIKT